MAEPTGQHSYAECVHRLVEACAQARPDREAVTAGGQSLSYAELNRRANLLAHRLAGYRRTAPSIGILLPRSADFVVSALAILKAGGSYVPLDDEYPRARLQSMIAAAGCELVVTDDALADRLSDTSVPLVMAAAHEPAGGSAAGNLDLPVHPDALAYTMFTSGSTGDPKGTMITHRGVVRLTQGPGIVPISEDDVVLHAASVAFDAATFDIWGALTNGARLVVAPAGRVSALELGRLIREQQVTTALLPTGLFHMMVDERLADLTGIRQLVVGGDVLSPSHARRFCAAAASTAGSLTNAYGPTEVTVATTTYRLPAEPEDGPAPIGSAMPGTTVRLLDDDLRPVPDGQPGQLYAGGVGLARGYAGDPGLTATRFVPDPRGSGGRLYATGDRAIRRPDGGFEFLARLDGQFKKRGFRVEPAEVERTLQAHPAVRQVIALGEGETADTRRLVAVVVLRPGLAAAEALEEVRAHARDVLPEYLVPDRWQALEELPLTSQGKVDRRALLDLIAAQSGAGESGRPDRPEAATDPATAATGADELALAEIWSELLKVEHIDSDSDFFDLGGHSLLANKVVYRVREQLGVAIGLDAVFDHPTLRELAAALGQARGGRASRALEPSEGR
ncbi:MAG: non-ribosomal peptide synthetase [Jatrophihabitantaceae bacterium]